jgi:hypothetical protein
MGISSLAAIMPTLRGKSTYPTCSDLPNHLCSGRLRTPATIRRLLKSHHPDSCIAPEIGPLAGQRAVEKLMHAVIYVLAKLGYRALGNA